MRLAIHCGRGLQEPAPTAKPILMSIARYDQESPYETCSICDHQYRFAGQPSDIAFNGHGVVTLQFVKVQFVKVQFGHDVTPVT